MAPPPKPTTRPAFHSLEYVCAFCCERYFAPCIHPVNVTPLGHPSITVTGHRSPSTQHQQSPSLPSPSTQHQPQTMTTCVNPSPLWQVTTIAPPMCPPRPSAAAASPACVMDRSASECTPPSPCPRDSACAAAEPARAPPRHVPITVTNVVSSVDMTCPVDMMDVALRGRNTQFTPRSGQNAVILSQRGGSTATVHASGKVVFMGGHCEASARTSARRHVRHIQTLG